MLASWGEDPETDVEIEDLRRWAVAEARRRRCFVSWSVRCCDLGEVFLLGGFVSSWPLMPMCLLRRSRRENAAPQKQVYGFSFVSFESLSAKELECN